MKARALIPALAVAITLAGCARVAESRFNPFNWFGQSESERVAAPVEAEDPRPRIAQVTALVIEPTPTGAIVRATGLAPTQGWFGAALIPETDEPVNGEMVYVFRAVPPRDPQPVSTVQSRELTVGRTLSQQDLAVLRTVRVIGARNALVVRR